MIECGDGLRLANKSAARLLVAARNNLSQILRGKIQRAGGNERTQLVNQATNHLRSVLALDGNNIQATNNVNFSYFNEPDWNQKMQEAAKLSGEERFTRYGDLDVELARDAAPWAATFISNNRDFFSERIGCQVYQPIYGMSLAPLCIRETG